MKLEKQSYIELIGLIVITLGLYWSTFQYDFVNFDDQVYVTNNSFVQQPSLDLLLDGSQTGNFHPLTMLSLRVDQWLGGGKASVFHISSVLWHLLNSILVFFFVSKIFPNKKGAAFFVALLFAIHPMHIESVAWISSRKDVVYVFFYLLSLLSYHEFLTSENKKFLLATLGFGVLSLLAKPAAITLPVALVLLHYLQVGKLEVKRSLSLIPLFVGSVIIGILTLQLQSDASINDLETYSMIERLGFASYGVFYYVSHAFFPAGLSAMHPYPDVDEMTNMSFLLPVILGLIITGLGILGIKKNKKLGFGILFFLLNLLLMLQFVSIGRAIVSERYTYLCYVGLLIALVAIIDSIPSISNQKSIFFILSFGLGIPFLWVSHQQIKVWNNSETLWSKAIEESPNDWYGYIGRGNYFKEKSLFQKALSDYGSAIQLAPDRYKNYFNLGDLQHQMGATQQAIATYSTAIQINPEYEEAYINRGQFYVALNDGAKALSDFNQAIALNPDSYLGYNNRGSLYLKSGNADVAIADFTKALELNSTYANAWYNRGTAYLNSNLNAAKYDLEQAILYNPNYFDAYNNLGSVYYQIQDYQGAIRVYSQALQINGSAANTWLNLSIIKNTIGDYNGALESAIQARQFGAQVSGEYIQQLQSQIR